MVNAAADVPEPEYRVSGSVMNQDGNPVANLRIEVFDSDPFTKDQRLAKGRTSADGTFNIAYPVESLSKRGKARPDLIVRVFDPAGVLMTSSQLMPRANTVTAVRLLVDRPSANVVEFEQVQRAVQPHLRGRPLADLTEAQANYLAQVSGVDKERIDRLVACAKCSRDLLPPVGTLLPHSALYAWSSQGIAVTPGLLVAYRRDQLKTALDRALAARVISEPSRKSVASVYQGTAAMPRSAASPRATANQDGPWTDAVEELLWHGRTTRELRPSEPGEALSVIDLFGDGSKAGDERHSLLPEEKLLILAELRSEAETTGMVDPALLKARGFSDAEIALTTRLTALAELTDNDRVLVKRLHAVAQIDPENPSGALVYLARLQPADWRLLLDESRPETIPTTRVLEGAQATKVAELEQKIESTFRTAVIAARIEQQQMAVPTKCRHDLNTFFARNPNFEFGVTGVDRALSEGGGTRLDGIVDLPLLRTSLLRLERTRKLTDNHAQQSVLLANAFDSAASIARVGGRDFVARMGAHPEIGTAKAELIYARAQQIASVALNLRLRQHDAGVALAVIGGASASPRGAAAVMGRSQVQIPDLATLFGSLDGGAIDPCISATSPAAYLADLLHYLQDRRVEPGAVSTELAVEDIEGTARSLDAHVLPASLRDAIAEATQLPMTSAPRITTLAPLLRWRIDSHATELNLTNTSYVFLQFQRDRGNKYVVPNSTLYSDLGELDLERVPASVLSTLRSALTISLTLGGREIGVLRPQNARILLQTKHIEWAVLFDYAVTFFQGIREDGNGNRSYYYGYLADGLPTNETAYSGAGHQADYDALTARTLPDHVVTELGLNSDWTIRKLVDDPDNVEWMLTRSGTSGIFFLAGLMASYPDGRTALDVLSARRPDLVNTEFSCENTQTTLPYVDLALEVMEAAASASIPRPIAIDSNDLAAAVADLDLAKLHARLAIAFVPPLPASTTVKVVHEGREWELVKPGRRFGVRAGLSMARDTGLSSSLATKTTEADVKALDAGELPASIRNAIHAHGIASKAFGAGLFFPTITKPKVVVVGQGWRVDYRYSVMIYQGRGEAPGILIGPEDRSFRALVPEDMIEDFFGALGNRNVPAVLRKEVFLGLDSLAVELRYENEFERGYEVWAQHTLAIEFHPLSVAWEAPQTSQPADTIASQPEHIDGAAYQILRAAGYPWSLPFDLHMEEARTYLAHLGVTRGRLKEVFDRNASFPDLEAQTAPFSDRHFRAAAERRGFTGGELAIISGAQKGIGDEGDPNYGPWNFWGFRAPTLSASNSIPDPCDTTRRIEQGQDWIDVLTQNVSVFLQQSGLAYNELRELLDMQFVNVRDFGGRIAHIEFGTIELAGGRGVLSNDLCLAKLTGWSTREEIAALLDRAHRFVRLWRRMGWRMRDVDRALELASLPLKYKSLLVLDEKLIGLLDRSEDLLRIHYQRKERILSLKLNRLYPDYEPDPDPLSGCLYERVFLSTSLSAPPDPAFLLNESRRDLKDTSLLAADHLPHIAAACSLSQQDASLLLSWLGPDSRLNLEFLSSMYWAGLIARTRKVEVRDVLDLLSLRAENAGLSELWLHDPSVVVLPQPVELGVKFISQRVGEINAIRFWKPEGEDGGHVGRLWDADGNLLGEVAFRFETASGWQEQRFARPIQVNAGSTYVASVNANTVMALTATGIRGGGNGRLRLPIDDNGVSGPPGTFPTVSTDHPNYYRDVGFAVHEVIDTDLLIVENALATGLKLPSLLRMLSHRQTAAEATEEERSTVQVLSELRRKLAAAGEAGAMAADLDELRRNLVRNDLQPVLDLDTTLVVSLLDKWVPSSTGASGKVAIEDLVASDFVLSPPGDPVTPARFPAQFRTIVRLVKAADLARQFELTKVSLSWLFEPPPAATGWLNPGRLPASSNESPADLQPWLRAASLFRLRERLYDGEASIARIFAAAATSRRSNPRLFEEISLATRWDVDDIAALFGPEGFRLRVAGQDAGPFVLQTEWFLHRLATCFDVIGRLGASSLQCLRWANSAIVGASEAADIQRAARSRHSEGGWVGASRPLRNALREKQRNALLSFLIGRDQLRDSRDLYDRYLIDVEMQPAMQTARIKQACASVQSFVQRCLLNLEPEVPPEAIDTEQWAWMKNFRVWEANRKVFLYPENWIEPELRDGKSEVFRNLESELQQVDVESAAAQRALRGYLDGLGDLAKVTILGLFHEHRPDEPRVTHVLGRSNATPSQHLYRQWIVPTFSTAGYWTPWERIDAGIDGPHVQVFTESGSTYVAWLVVKQADGSGMQKISVSVAQRERKGWASLKRCRDELTALATPNINVSRAFRLQYSRTGKTEYGISLDVLAAAFPKRRTPRDLSLSNTEANGARDPTVVFSLRVLARYVDRNGVTFYWEASDVPQISLRVFIHYREAYDGGAAGETVSNKYGVGLVPVRQGEVKLKTLLRPIGDDNLEGACLTVELSLAVKDIPHYRSTAITKQFDTATLSRYSLVGDFIIDMVDDEYWLVKADRSLANMYTSLGSYAVDSSGALALREPAKALPQTVLVPRYFEYYDSNFQESPSPEDEPLGFPLEVSGVQLFGPSSGRHLSTGSVDIPMLAYSDSAVDCVVWRDSLASSGAFRVFPASFPWLPRVREASIEGQLGRLVTVQSNVTPLVLGTGSDQLDEAGSHLSIGIDFEPELPWSPYNWEIFFHVPILVATQLSSNKRHEEAQRWFHLVFDPTSGTAGEGPERFWQFRPFKATTSGTSIERDLLDLAAGDTKLHDQIALWREKPFQPHAIARARPRAYQFFVVMKYVDNLLAWGDRLFLNDTIESINEATQLYVLASRVLGRRPREVTMDQRASVRTFNDLPDLDEFSNALVQLESLVPSSVSPGASISMGPSGLYRLQFGIPMNVELSRYWDRVEDRLFKIRHSLNFEGLARQLPLYEPPIDPAILVRATAAGIDIASALNDLRAPLPYQRFGVVAQKALDLANEVRALGSNLLSAIEKGDGEMLSMTRSTQEVAILRLVGNVRQNQVAEARSNASSLRQTRELVGLRYMQYQRLLGKPDASVPPEGSDAAIEATPARALPGGQGGDGDAGGLALASNETDHLAWLSVANSYSITSGSLQSASGLAHGFPNLTTGYPPLQVTYGGQFVGHVLSALASAAGVGAANASFQANRSATVGGHKRRFDDWAFQSNLAAKELQQIDKQLAAADLRVAIAELEVRNHEAQVSNAEENLALMREKFSNQQLYRWIRGQAVNVHFRAFQLAHAMAKRAEKAFCFDLGLADGSSSFIQATGYWDNLRKGLLSGETLASDIRRMDSAFLETNRRELEITKHVSLRRLDGSALMQLRATGQCTFKIPEALFDLDFPGHFMRRIKSVSISVPCVVGPYTSVSGTLGMTRSWLRRSAQVQGEYADGSNFAIDYVAVQPIATSSSQNDSGLFELNFRDERYLPFEGGGAISEWTFSLPADFRAFDYGTISDLVIHLRYTARDGGAELARLAKDSLKKQFDAVARDAAGTDLVMLASVRQDFAAQWQRARQRPDVLVALPLTEELFPYAYRSLAEVESARFAWISVGGDGRPELVTVQADAPSGSGGGLPSIGLPRSVVESTDDPWLIASYRVSSTNANSRSTGVGSASSGSGELPDQLVTLGLSNAWVAAEVRTSRETGPTTEVRFKFGEARPSPSLREGESITLMYDPRRTQVSGFANGIPAYGVTAYVKFKFADGRPEETSRHPALGFRRVADASLRSTRILGDPHAIPIVLNVPMGATAVEFWFEQFAGGDRPPQQAWDRGDDRQNYRYDIARR